VDTVIPELSDDENVRILVEQFGLTEERARLVVAIEKGESDGDLVAADGPMTVKDRRRVGLGRSIFEPIDDDPTPAAGSSATRGPG
jgi:hypothetical protein